MYTTDIIPVTVNGRKLGIRWTYDAIIAAERIFGLEPGAKFKDAIVAYAKQHGYSALWLAIGFCMLQSADEPPTLKELGRMSAEEGAQFNVAVRKAMGIGEDGPLPKKKIKNEKGSSAARPPSGTGARRSRKRSTSAASVPPSSSASPLSSSG